MQAIEAVTTPGETAALCQSVGVSRASLYRRRRAQARHPAYAAPDLTRHGVERLAAQQSQHDVPLAARAPPLPRPQDPRPSHRGVGTDSGRADPSACITCLDRTISPTPLAIGFSLNPCPRKPGALYSRFTPTAARPCAASSSRCCSRIWASPPVMRAPRVSNDNPFSEAQFRTVKYRPEFPGRFGALEHARGVSRDLFAWYNDAHHHSGLSYLTPADVHYGRAATVLAARHRTRLAAYAGAHPERFVQGPPRPETLPTAVWINRPPTHPSQAAPSTTTVTPNDLQPGVMGPPPRIDDRTATLVTSVGVATLNAESGCLKVVDTARISCYIRSSVM